MGSVASVIRQVLGGHQDDDEDYMEDEREVEYGSWGKAELFRLEKSVLTFG